MAILSGLFVRYAGSKLAKKIIIKLIGIYVKRTDNKLDDQIYASIVKLLEKA
jgi:hypothetical protein